MPLIFVSSNKHGANGRDRNGPKKIVQISKADLKEFLPVVKRTLRSGGERQKRKRAQGLHNHLGEYDPLTNLPNRNLIHRLLQQAITISRRDKESFALLIMGLNRFKEINHTLGPHNGDLLLKEVAERFAGGLKRFAAKGRLGGDEFAAILPHASSQTALTLSKHLLQSLEAPFVVNDIPIDLSGSVGIAFYPEHGSDANSLFQHADVAMYLAKQYSRGYAIYNPSDDPYSQQRLAILGGIRKAIERNELVLHFQPKIHLLTGKTTGVEALIRWHHPQLGLLPPDRFVPLAERTGLIHTLSLWVIRAALDKCRVWRRAGLDISVAVNLSARNLHDPHLPQHIAEMLSERRLRPTCLEVEITESAIMADATLAMEVLTRLSEMGVRVYIDDFGTGYSSLGYLKRLPVDGIKIDKSFVTHMAADENDSVIVRSTIDLGHTLGLQVIAEGVESRAIWDRLRVLGCDAAQGYYMSRPIPPADLERWLLESPWGLVESRQRQRD